MDNRIQKTVALCGIIAPIFAFACILSAVASWSQFSWANNALSDLGVQQGITAIVFNVGLVVSGLLFLVFAAGLFTLMGKQVLGKVGAFIFALSCIALIGIGVFNESFSPTHYQVSVAFFVLFPISLLVLSAAFWRSHQRGFGVFTLGVALVAAAVWVLEFTLRYVPNVAVPEFVSGFAGAIWMEALSFRMLKTPSNSTPP